ncbi:hypothetical protein [Haladaptatus salinisoli]|uniref:hypothetical protein n=1 Tax=Haladaptatus salinisoli TaxID=2884876 RepID=UPI001D09DC14|nr:hypothetical protein [Haladaptatus salinisoli]
MSRFSADAPKERRKLVADAIAAHRTRGSAFCTLQAGFDPEAAAEAEREEVPPWIQFGDNTINADCTDEELERLKALLREFPAFKVEELHSPEEAEGTNVRISAKADANRIAQFVERAFREAYECPETFTLWAVEV